MFRVILGLGGNIGDTQERFAVCLAALATDGRVVAVSRLWRTRAVGPPQDDYLNAAAVVEWPAGPHDLHARCQVLERLAGRVRSQEERWGPRALDLDILVAQNVVCRGPSLEIPHPRLHQRAFALGPAAEVAPNWVHPLLGKTIADLARQAIDDDPAAILEVSDFNF